MLQTDWSCHVLPEDSGGSSAGACEREVAIMCTRRDKLLTTAVMVRAV